MAPKVKVKNQPKIGNFIIDVRKRNQTVTDQKKQDKNQSKATSKKRRHLTGEKSQAKRQPLNSLVNKSGTEAGGLVEEDSPPLQPGVSSSVNKKDSSHKDTGMKAITTNSTNFTMLQEIKEMEEILKVSMKENREKEMKEMEELMTKNMKVIIEASIGEAMKTIGQIVTNMVSTNTVVTSHTTQLNELKAENTRLNRNNPSPKLGTEQTQNQIGIYRKKESQPLYYPKGIRSSTKKQM